MKRLILRRRSLKDGPHHTVGIQGLRLAEREGKRAKRNDAPVKIFHGPQVQSAQTAMAFSKGLGYVPAYPPIVDGLGDKKLFEEIATPTYKAVVRAGLSRLHALLHAHHEDAQLERWVKSGHQAVLSMFAQLEEGEIGVGFFHSPTIELAAWSCHADQSGIQDWDHIDDMEGLIFEKDGRKIRVTGKICVKN